MRKVLDIKEPPLTNRHGRDEETTSIKQLFQNVDQVAAKILYSKNVNDIEEEQNDVNDVKTDSRKKERKHRTGALSETKSHDKRRSSIIQNNSNRTELKTEDRDVSHIDKTEHKDVSHIDKKNHSEESTNDSDYDDTKSNIPQIENKSKKRVSFSRAKSTVHVHSSGNTSDNKRVPGIEERILTPIAHHFELPIYEFQRSKTFPCGQSEFDLENSPLDDLTLRKTELLTKKTKTFEGNSIIKRGAKNPIFYTNNEGNTVLKDLNIIKVGQQPWINLTGQGHSAWINSTDQKLIEESQKQISNLTGLESSSDTDSDSVTSSSCSLASSSDSSLPLSDTERRIFTSLKPENSDVNQEMDQQARRASQSRLGTRVANTNLDGIIGSDFDKERQQLNNPLNAIKDMCEGKTTGLNQ